MIVRKEELVRAMDILSVIPQRAGIPPSEYVRLEVQKKNKLHLCLSSDALCDVAVGIEGSWPVAEPYFGDRSLLIPFVRAAKEIRSKKDFEFTGQDGVLNIRHGRRRIVLPPLPAITGYGEITDGVDPVSINLDQAQREIIKCAASFATTDPISPHLNCVYMTEDGLVMASNQVVIFSGKTKKFDKSLPMPLFMLQLLALDGVEKLVFSKKQAVLKLDCGEILQTVTRQAVRDFPSGKIVERIEEASRYEKVVSIDSKKLATVLHRFLAYMESLRRQDKVVLLTATGGENVLKVSAKVASVELLESLKLEEPAKADFKAEWGLEMVLPLLTFLGEKNKAIQVGCNKKSPYYVDGGDIQVLLARKIS